MSERISLGIRTTLAPEMVMGDTRMLEESQAIVLRLPWAAFVWSRPRAVTVVRNGCGLRVQIHRQPTQGVHTMIETVDGRAPSSAALQNHQQTDEFFERVLAAARPSAVFSAPVVSGAYTVITASEIFACGFGFGGGSHSRPVAAVVIGPKGVKVRPVVDATRIALGAFSVSAGIALIALRMARGRARGSRFRPARRTTR
jgi:hypothetical protein